MDVVFQDVTVTAVALAAALVLLQRLRNTLSSARKKPSCGACPGCEQPARNTVTLPGRT